MVRDHRATRLRDDVGRGHVGVVAGLLDGRHDIVRVLLERVIHGRVELGPGSVVIHRKAAPDVQQAQLGTHLLQADVDAAHLPQRLLVGPDGRDLGADVRMDEFEAVEHILGS